METKELSNLLFMNESLANKAIDLETKKKQLFVERMHFKEKYSTPVLSVVLDALYEEMIKRPEANTIITVIPINHLLFDKVYNSQLDDALIQLSELECISVEPLFRSIDEDVKTIGYVITYVKDIK